ncbi:hypothetical protein PA598K_00418 [Paenibacillus sp. 598K]|nr:hypothetical protein PA598K_00418 [Paenibacillus sp. 598K]
MKQPDNRSSSRLPRGATIIGERSLKGGVSSIITEVTLIEGERIDLAILRQVEVKEPKVYCGWTDLGVTVATPAHDRSLDAYKQQTP